MGAPKGQELLAAPHMKYETPACTPQVSARRQGGTLAPEVWDLRETGTLRAAVDLAAGRKTLPSVHGSWPQNGHEALSAARRALTAATACSSAGRRTPLHIAAELGMLEVLGR